MFLASCGKLSPTYLKFLSIKSLNNKAAKIIEMDKISCEYFAEITFNYIEETLANLDITVVSVEVSEHDSNSAGFYRN